MLVILPFCDKDEWLAVRNLEWAYSLDGRTEFECLVVCQDTTEPRNVLEKAGQLFSKVGVFRYSFPFEHHGWPISKNVAFQETCRWLWDHKQEGSFLWWEPDATPLKKGWLKTIAERHAGNMFTGHVVSGMGHMDCVGVYPNNYLRHSITGMLTRAAPWDHASKGEISHMVTPANDLFQLVWDVDGQPPTFSDPQLFKELVSSDAVLFHRCKDGTLIDRLSGGKIKTVPGKPFQPKPKSVPIADKCMVMLGRYGDIINVLPMLKHINDTEGQPTLVIQQDFADVLEGVTYVKPQKWAGHFTDVNEAVAKAKTQFGTVLVAQVNGRNFGVTTECDSFAAESWRQCGLLSKWNDLPLVFDNRSPKRESKLAGLITRKKCVLYNFTGKSSPYPFEAQLLDRVRADWGQSAQFIDLGQVKAERIFDLLGLMDKASCFITTDTSTLHLSYASKCPTIALITDTPSLWHGARPRSNVKLAVRYRESRHRFEEISRVVGQCLSQDAPRLVHVYSDHESKDSDTARRNQLAFNTWQTEYKSGSWTSQPVQDKQLPRLFDDKVRSLPYIKDLINEGIKHARDTDVIVLTNTDTCFVRGIATKITERLDHVEACYSFRRDFSRLSKQLSSDEVLLGKLYVGSDLYAFRAGWWKKHQEKMPDMVLSAEGWDWCLRLLIEETNKGPTAFSDVIYHERHASLWEQPKNRTSLASQKHNRKLAKKFLSDRGLYKGELD